VLDRHGQADVTVQLGVCRTFRRHFLLVGNVEVFLESVAIASACNKPFRKTVPPTEQATNNSCRRIHRKKEIALEGNRLVQTTGE
jgi:hypothetical protein